MGEEQNMALIHFLSHGFPFRLGFIDYAATIDFLMCKENIHPFQVTLLSSDAKQAAKNRRWSLKQDFKHERFSSFQFSMQCFCSGPGKPFVGCCGLFVHYAVTLEPLYIFLSRPIALMLPQMYLKLTPSFGSFWCGRRIT
jgi:hypothetical protein